MKTLIILTIALLLGFLLHSFEVLLEGLALIVGLCASTLMLALWSIFFKGTLAHDPNNLKKLAWFVEVQGNRSVVIQRGGRPTHVLRGDEPPVSSDAFFGLWMVYKNYVMKTTGYHVYMPFFTSPTVYDLPRYRVKEKDGKKIFVVVEEGAQGYISNHVRTAYTTWYFEFAGAEIEKIPFTIKGSVQIRIPRGREVDALYMTDSWNVLLDQALNSTIRTVVRRDLSLDMIIGATKNDLLSSNSNSADPFGGVAKLIMDGLGEYELSRPEDGSPGPTLIDVGIEVLRADIIDFEDELSSDEKTKLRSAALTKEVARGIAITAQAEATGITLKGKAEASVIKLKGTATAGAQKKLVDVHEANPQLAEAIITADALRAFASKDGGLIDAVAATFLKGTKK